MDFPLFPVAVARALAALVSEAACRAHADWLAQSERAGLR